jgi:predicted dehydrogenase
LEQALLMEHRNEKMRVGLVGLGKMGAIRAGVLSLREDVELVCGYDPAPQEFHAAYPGVALAESADAVIASDVDAVFIATPNKHTPGLVVAALEAGKHVFCEKPPGRGVADIERIRTAEAAAPQCRLKFGFNHRYHAGIQEAKRIVDSGRLGQLLWARAVYGKAGGPGFESGWRSDPDLAGAGILLDQGIHMLDLLHWFFGAFAEVKSMVTTAYWNVGVEDNAFALLRDAQGRIAQVHSSSTQWKHRFMLELYLSEGYLSVNGILSSSRSYGDETITVARRRFDPGFSTGAPTEETIYFDNDPSWEREVEDFVQCVREGSPVELGNSTQALEAMRLVAAIYAGDGAPSK